VRRKTRKGLGVRRDATEAGCREPRNGGFLSVVIRESESDYKLDRLLDQTGVRHIALGHGSDV
jgi:hypothetical protein